MSYTTNENALGLIPPHKMVIITRPRGVRPHLKETLSRSLRDLTRCNKAALPALIPKPSPPVAPKRFSPELSRPAPPARVNKPSPAVAPKRSTPEPARPAPPVLIPKPSPPVAPKRLSPERAQAVPTVDSKPSSRKPEPLDVALSQGLEESLENHVEGGLDSLAFA